MAKQVTGSIVRIGTDGFMYINNDKGGFGFKPSKGVSEQFSQLERIKML